MNKLIQQVKVNQEGKPNMSCDTFNQIMVVMYSCMVYWKE